MATQVAQVKTTKNGAFHKIFGPAAAGCSGSCNYTWDCVTREYVLVLGDACTGNGCTPCAPTMPAVVHDLVTLENAFPNPEQIGHVCGATPAEQLEALLGIYVKLIISYRFFMKLSIGLGALSAILLIAVVYLLMR
jgi:hypothetical protein